MVLVVAYAQMPLLALSLLAVTFSSADNLCKQFGSRSGSKLFDTLIVFCKVLFESLILENDDKSMKNYPASVILIPAHPVSYTQNFVSGMQSIYFRESQDAMVLQTCH